MATYLHPGVYIEEIPSGARPIEAVGTSTAAFVGFATRGPLDAAVRITKWDAYERDYGGVTGPEDVMGQSVAAFYSNGGSSAYIVRVASGALAAEGFLLHPDTADPANPQPTDRLMRFAAANPGSWGNALRVTLGPKTEGSVAYTLVVEEQRAPAPGLPRAYQELERITDLSLDPASPDYIEGIVAVRSGLVAVEVQQALEQMVGESRGQRLEDDADLTDANGRELTVAVDGTDRAVSFAGDAFDAGSTLADVAAEIQKQVRGGVTANAAVAQFTAAAEQDALVLRSGKPGPASRVVVTGPVAAASDATAVLELGAAHEGTERTGAQVLADLIGELVPGGDNAVALAGGADGAPGDAAAYADVFSLFTKIRDINMIVLPGMAWDSTGTPVVQAAVAHAEAMRDRMVLIDPPRDTVLTTEGEVGDLNLPTSTYAALYYPWVTVPSPSYNPETNPAAPPTVAVPPSGFAAGVWARIDGKRNVWKAPAGTETALLGLAGLDTIVEDGEQDVLNPSGVNCLRRFPGYGFVVWGSRTLATRANPEWRYVPVRRTAIFIEQSVYNGIQWAVFEPNDVPLWSSLRTNIDSFMDGLFRAGAFQGQKASDAYFVRCGLGDTMTQGDIDRGQVVVIIGFAPLKPAEFVIVRIQQKVGQQ